MTPDQALDFDKMLWGFLNGLYEMGTLLSFSESQQVSHLNAVVAYVLLHTKPDGGGDVVVES